MNAEQEDSDEQLPVKMGFSDKGIEIAASFDKLMASIYSALIAGIVLLLLKEELSFWVGAPFILSLACFILGIGHTLVHMAFMSKMLFLAEHLANRTHIVPNAVEQDEPTIQAFARNLAYAQTAHSSQMLYLLFGISFAGLAVAIRLWEYFWRAGIIFLACLIILFAIATLIAFWRRTLKKHRPSTMASRKQG